MTAERAVDVILSGFALGESVILPSVESSQLLRFYEEARLALRLHRKPAVRRTGIRFA